MLGKLVELEQGTDEWLEVRMGKFTGSAVAAIMDQAKYKPRNFREYWQWRKGELVLEPIGSFGDWGHAQEPIAMNKFCAELQTEFAPACIVHEDLMSSLDGYNQEASAQFEVKCPMKGKKSATWKYVEENGEVPPWYIWQIVMGHHLTEVDHSFFGVYDGNTGTSLPIVEVSNNYLTHLWHDELAPAIERMREALKSDVAPGELTDPELVKKVDRLRVVMEEKKGLAEEESEIKDALKEASGGENAWCNGASIAWYESTRFNKAKAKKDGVPVESYESVSVSARVNL